MRPREKDAVRFKELDGMCEEINYARLPVRASTANDYKKSSLGATKKLRNSQEGINRSKQIDYEDEREVRGLIDQRTIVDTVQ